MIRFLTVLLLLQLAACTKKSNPPSNNNPGTPVQPGTTLITLPAGWRLATSYTTTFPQGIQLYQFDSVFNGQTIKAFCLAYDSRNTTFEFKPVLATAAKTVSAFVRDEPGSVFAGINGGYFGSPNQSFSLVQYNGAILSPNIKSVTRSFNGSNVPYYPTRAAFGLTSAGSPQVGWIYHVGAGNDLIYGYPSPSPNALGTAPQPQPTASFPAGGIVWNTTAAIGGSPLLIRNNTIQITDAEELIDINNNTNRPRSAIGFSGSGMVLLLAVEGDNPPNYPGVNLATTAALMQSLGCQGAINLDGGGSTALIVNNTSTVRAGGTGTERAVMSAVLIKRR
ncbi:MAG TPA: phosphodiester glycosidase family protein [Lacibacter sp.]|nr:phosphodiester glycosidase family protein [Lacibacter sp.]HMO89148.1 phosphodiester glycosidase family protein [Lacibacter sp.]